MESAIVDKFNPCPKKRWLWVYSVPTNLRAAEEEHLHHFLFEVDLGFFGKRPAEKEALEFRSLGLHAIVSLKPHPGKQQSLACGAQYYVHHL